MQSEKLKKAWSLIKQTFSEWSEDKAPRLAAALAYYTVFSLAPLLVIVIGVAGLVFGQEAAQGQIVGQIEHLVGNKGAEAIQTMLAGASKPTQGIIATVVGGVTLIIGATGVFGELQDSMNTIWEVKPKPGQGILGTLKQRFFSFTMVLGTGFLLLVSLVLSAAVAAFAGLLEDSIPGASVLSRVLTFVLSLGVSALIFALIFKLVPDVEIQWKDVWIGALVTAVLFSLGRFALGEYLGRGSFASSYGAVGSLVVVLFWIYYSAQIIFLGAEFTQVYARCYGSKIVPSRGAIPLTADDRAQQGIPRRAAIQAAATPAAPEPERQRVEAPVRVSMPRAPARATPGATLAGFVVGMLLGRRKSHGH